jgi:predicted PurR-regulated permease PerM
MAIASIIPYVGTGFIWLPTGIIMIISGQLIPGIIILLVGALIISSVDNILSPKLIGKDSKMHPLLILFSTLGGIIFFGAAGFIIGPIVVSFFVVLWDIYLLEFKKQLTEYN